jgi:hypothetical protein
MSESDDRDGAMLYRTVQALLRMAGDREPGTERTIYGMALQAERKLEKLRFQLREARATVVEQKIRRAAERVAAMVLAGQALEGAAITEPAFRARLVRDTVAELTRSVKSGVLDPDEIDA